MQRPLVSIVMNCHNGELYLKEALDSIFNQTYKNWEIIFFDNASSDRSSEIAQSYGKKLKYFYNKEIITLGQARAEAINLCSGDWICFLDTDDLWFEKKLEIQLNSVQGTNYILTYAAVEEVDRNGKHIRNDIPKHPSGDMLKKQLQNFEINMVTPMILRNSLQKNNLNFNADVLASEEYNLFIRLAAKGPFHSSKKVLGKYRLYENSLTNKYISRWSQERFLTLEQLIEENSGILKKISIEFMQAISRGVYYESRYLFSKKDYKKARRLLSKIAIIDLRYAILKYVSYFPIIWNFIHRKISKSILTQLFNKTKK